MKTGISFFSHDKTTFPTYRSTRYLPVSSSCCCRSLQQVPRSYCCTKKVTLLESSYSHHVPACPSTCRFCARGNRAMATISQHVPPVCAQLADVVTTPSVRRRHPNAGRARRVESIMPTLILIVGQGETQVHSSTSTKSSPTTPDYGSHRPHRPPRIQC